MKPLHSTITKLSCLIFCGYLFFSMATALASTPTPPGQPTTGPGSDNYPHASYTKRSYGSGDFKYWLYEPASPKPAIAPVMLYAHGFLASNPKYYEEMLIHFARKGITVVYPRFADVFGILQYEANAKTMFENALTRLQNGSHVAPDYNRVIFSGHSLGTQIVLRMAETASQHNYPAPKVIALHDADGAVALVDFPLDNLSNIDSSTLLMFIARDDWDQSTDTYPVPVTAWHGTEHLINRNFIVVKNDNYGTPDIVSEHRSVLTGRAYFWEIDNIPVVDTVDWHGYWKPTEAAINFALYSADGQYVLGAGNDVTDMGQWSDGTPVNPKQVVSDNIFDNLYLTLP